MPEFLFARLIVFFWCAVDCIVEGVASFVVISLRFDLAFFGGFIVVVAFIIWMFPLGRCCVL